MESSSIRMDGHILDSLLLPKVLDLIVEGGGDYVIEEISIGRTRHDQSHAVIRITAPDLATLVDIQRNIAPHGAQPS